MHLFSSFFVQVLWENLAVVAFASALRLSRGEGGAAFMGNYLADEEDGEGNNDNKKGPGNLCPAQPELE